MSKNSTSKVSQTDWAYIDALRDEDIDLSDIPEVTEDQMARAVLRVGGQPVPKGKVHVTMALDAAIVAYFKSRAGGRGYQTLINKTLRENIRERDLETTLRRVIREELTTIARPVQAA